MYFGQWLRQLREDRGMTQETLAAALGTSVVSVGKWENGRGNPSYPMIRALCKALRVSADVLLDISAPEKIENFFCSDTERELVELYRDLDRPGKRVVSSIAKLEWERVQELASARGELLVMPKRNAEAERYIPKYTTPAAAGSSMPLDGEDFEMIKVTGDVPYNADCAVMIQGNSMLPYISDGDMVYVQKGAELSVGDIGIFCVDGAMYCKHYYADTENNVLLVSANPAYSDTNISICSDSGMEASCFGKVLLSEAVCLPDYLFEHNKTADE